MYPVKRSKRADRRRNVIIGDDFSGFWVNNPETVTLLKGGELTAFEILNAAVLIN
jgi:hypothetical protein